MTKKQPTFKKEWQQNSGDLANQHVGGQEWLPGWPRSHLSIMTSLLFLSSLFYLLVQHWVASKFCEKCVGFEGVYLCRKCCSFSFSCYYYNRSFCLSGSAEVARQDLDLSQHELKDNPAESRFLKIIWNSFLLKKKKLKYPGSGNDGNWRNMFGQVFVFSKNTNKKSSKRVVAMWSSSSTGLTKWLSGQASWSSSFWSSDGWSSAWWRWLSWSSLSNHPDLQVIDGKRTAWKGNIQQQPWVQFDLVVETFVSKVNQIFQFIFLYFIFSFVDRRHYHLNCPGFWDVCFKDILAIAFSIDHDVLDF